MGGGQGACPDADGPSGVHVAMSNTLATPAEAIELEYPLRVDQWARALGATVIGTVGSIEKARIARSHGCAYPIVYTEEDFVERVRNTKGEGCQAVYDAVGRDTFLGSFEALAIRGHLVSYGQASGRSSRWISPASS